MKVATATEIMKLREELKKSQRSNEALFAQVLSELQEIKNRLPPQ
jgi:hypothetical protein